MLTRRRFVTSLAALPPLASINPAALWAAVPGASRIALVMGNSAYPAAPLENPVNDATAMSGLFSEAGFSVDKKVNATRVDMLAAIEQFGDMVRRAETRLAVFYYAGHGAQLDWRNYLLPVDAEVRSAEQLKQRCVDLGALLSKFSGVKDKTFIIILDACRNDPFGGRFRVDQKGLSQFDAPVGSLLAYSTAPGNVASDGGGRNGLYTENLLRELAVRGTRLEDGLKRVRLNVRLQSNGEQIPWETTSLESDVFIFSDGKKRLSESEIEKELEEDLAEWGRIKSSIKLDDWVSYLKKFPNGRFAEIGQARLSRLLEERSKAGVAPGKLADTAKPAIDAPPLLEIKSGVAPVKLWRPSPNPYSAGRYPLGRNFSVGDVYVHRETDFLTGVEVGIRTRRVTLVDVPNDRVEINDGRLVVDLMGNPIKAGEKAFDQPLQYSPAEVHIGKKWRAIFRLTKPEGVFSGHYDMEVVAREKITVPAGEIDTFLIEGLGFNQQGGQLQTRLWIVPGINFAIRVENVHRNKSGRYAKTERLELISLRQRHIEQL